MAGLALWLLVYSQGPLINDVGWQLWVGRQINSGMRLYVDILEVNPPLWFWFGAAIQSSAAVLGTNGHMLLLAAFSIVALVSMVLIKTAVRDARDRNLSYAGLLLSLTLTSPHALGQREQYLAIVMLPYIALFARRAQGISLSPLVSVAIALLAASGFALKHYFALLPAALELWLWFRTRRVSVRPELIVLAGCAVTYVAAIGYLTPEYFTVMVPLIRTAYSGYDVSLAQQLGSAGLFAVMLALLAAKLNCKPLSLLAQACFVSAATLGIIYFLQAKGFDYHLVPAVTAAITGTLLLFTERPRLSAGTAAAAMALLLACVMPFVSGPSRFDDAAAEATDQLKAGAGLVVLSASGSVAWPLIEEKQFDWPSRHMTLWMLGPSWLASRHDPTTPQAEALATDLRLETASEILCARPAMILVDQRFAPLLGGDVLNYFLAEPAFARAMRSYRREPDVRYLSVYSRAAGSSGRLCRPARYIKRPVR